MMLETVIEQLRSPLMQIHLLSQNGEIKSDINLLTLSLIDLLDNMQIASSINRQQLEMPMEPINLLVIAEDTAHKLAASAAMHDINLQIRSARRQPVLANRDFLRRAYESMTSSIIDLSKNNEGTTITLRADEIDGATRFGVYASGVDFAAQDLRTLRKLFGHTARPMARVTTSPAAQLYIADRLLRSMGARLRTSIASHERGLATVLPLSRQLSMEYA